MKQVVQSALMMMMRGKRAEERFDKLIPIRLQAANFCAYFRDLRTIKRSMTTGIRLDPIVRYLVELVDVSGEHLSYIYFICFAVSVI